MPTPNRTSTRARKARAGVVHESLDAFAQRSKSVGATVTERLGITLDDTELALLRVLAGAEVVRMGELGTAAGVAASTATEGVDRLVAKGVVERARSDIDRRIVVVRLTPSGRQVHTELARAQVDLCAEVLAGFSDAEQAMLVEVLQRLGGGAGNKA